MGNTSGQQREEVNPLTLHLKRLKKNPKNRKCVCRNVCASCSSSVCETFDVFNEAGRVTGTQTEADEGQKHSRIPIMRKRDAGFFLWFTDKQEEIILPLMVNESNTSLQLELPHPQHVKHK